jgi:transketolase
MEPLRDKLASFGWNVCPETYDGNNTEDILKSFQWMDKDEIWPKVVIYDTIKGKGVSFTEGKNAWHGAAIDDDNFNKGMPELKADLEKKEARL